MTSKNADSCVNRFVCDGVDKRYRIRVLQQVKPDQRPPPRKNERQSESRKSSRSVVRQKRVSADDNIQVIKSLKQRLEASIADSGKLSARAPDI